MPLADSELDKICRGRIIKARVFDSSENRPTVAHWGVVVSPNDQIKTSPRFHAIMISTNDQIDPETTFFELGLWAAWEMYAEWGRAPSAGVVVGIGQIAGRRVMIIANDATVKAGAFFPMTAKKVLRAQRIAMQNRLPLAYLVDSAGVFLPLQDEVFPDEDDFGRIFRNNAVISALGIPQYAAILGNCVAGGGYLPVLCDKVLMTEGSGLYLAAPALVKAAIGQIVEEEELGGAKMHAEISGTVDFYEKDDGSCLSRLRSLVSLLPDPARAPSQIGTGEPAKS